FHVARARLEPGRTAGLSAAVGHRRWSAAAVPDPQRLSARARPGRTDRSAPSGRTALYDHRTLAAWFRFGAPVSSPRRKPPCAGARRGYGDPHVSRASNEAGMMRGLIPLALLSALAGCGGAVIPPAAPPAVGFTPASRPEPSGVMGA